jgi:polar amino acid transport system substrate-binding protein
MILTLHLSSTMMAGDLEDIVTRGSIRVGVKAHAPPFSVKNIQGKMEGFDIGMAQALASYLEVELDLVPLSSADRVPFLKENKVDLVVATMTITRAREKMVDFSIPYFKDGQSLLVLDSGKVKSYQDLEGTKVGAVAGTTSLKNLPLVSPDCVPVPFETPNQAVDALIAGKIDAFSSDMLMLLGLKLSHPQKALLKIRGGKFTNEPYGVALRPNQSNLRDTIDEAIMAMWKSGTWRSLYDKWFGRKSPFYHENNFEVQAYH